MNKKILSCALVAAMLASSVGAMGVSAYDKDNADAFTNYYTSVAKNDLKTASADLSQFSSVDATYALEHGELDKNLIYLENYAPKKTLDGVTIEDVYDAIAEAKDNNDTKKDNDPTNNDKYYNAAIKMMSDYFEADDNDTLDGTFNAETTSGVTASGRRSDAIDKFRDVLKDVKDNFDPSYYDTVELENYGVYTGSKGQKGDLVVEIKNLDGANLEKAVTVRLEYLSYEYDRLIGSEGMLSTNNTWEDCYEEKLADAEALTEDDYTASNWAKVEYQMRLAALEAEKGTAAGFKSACAELDKIFNTIETVKPNYSELEDVLEGLFGNGKIRSGIYLGDDEKVHNYLANDYKDGRDFSDAWYEFAGRDDDNETKDVDEYIEGAYRKAYAVWNKCDRPSTRKYVAQSTVDKVLGELNDAILALDPNYETSNWVTVMLEDALEKANAVVEDDYRTTSSYWKTFVKDKEYVEKLLETDNVKDSTADKAVVDLLGSKKDGKGGSMGDLSKCKLTVPTATKNALKDAMDEAKDLLKDKTGKTSAQITALQNAYDAAKEIGTSNTISEYENATTDLNNAMTNYKHPQGWYKGTDGLWYYGKEDSIAKGWLNVNGTWYYLDATSGAMKTGWQQVNGTWYYLNASGAMQTGWLNLNGKYYYLESWGGMATGWKNVNGSWYYLQGSGEMVANGWYWINGKCYYFRNWGGMAANTTIDGYKVGADGAWVK